MILERIAGLPTDVLDFPHASAPLVEETLVAQAARQSAEHDLAETIFRLVPQASTSDRRTLLRARRALHNGRPLAAEEDQAVRRIAARDSVAVDAALAKEKTLRRELEDAIADDDEQSHRHLAQLAANGPFSRALALVSPDMFLTILKSGRNISAQTTRALLSYAIRAAVKPSPLSSFASIGIPEADLLESDVRLSSTVVHSLRRAAALSPRYGHFTTVLRSQTWAVGVSDYADVVDSDQLDGSLPWTPLRTVRLESGAVLPSNTEKLGGPRTRRLIHAGLAQPAPPPDGRPMDVCDLIQEWNDNAPTASTDLRSSLVEIDRLAASAHADDSGQRAGAVLSLRLETQKLFNEFEASPPRSSLIYEDTGVERVATPDERESTALERIREHIRPQLFRSHAYDVLLDTFVDTHGAGASGVPLLQFVRHCSVDPKSASAIVDAESADRGGNKSLTAERSFLPVGKSSAPPTAGVIYQMLPPKSDVLAVVNQFTNGSGALYARYSHLDPTGTMDAIVRAAVEGRYPGVPRGNIGAFIPSLESSSLQAGASRSLPLVSWDGPSGYISLSALRVSHDRDRDVLEIHRDGGEPFAVVHFGVVPAWLSRGPVSLAMTLMDPWRDGSRHTARSHPSNRLSDAANGLGQRPREVSDGVILQRRTWVVHSEDVPSPRSTANPVDLMIEIRRWQIANSLPDEVFAWSIGDDPYDESARKPLWIDLRSYTCVTSLLPQLRSRTYLRLQEVLPIRSDAAEGDGHVRERFAHVSWERP